MIGLVGATLIDGNGGPPQRDTTIVIDDQGRIAEVSPRTRPASGVHRIDVSGCWVLPGIIDTHVHLASWAQWLISLQRESLMHLAARTAHAMKLQLAHGITTVRDLGGLDAGFAEAQATDLIPGPRIQTGVVIIEPTGGVTDAMPGTSGATSPQGLFTSVPGIPAPYCDGPDDVRRKVRQVLRSGADVIKITATSVRMRHQDNFHGLLAPAFTRDELRACVDEAHGKGVKVACHASGGPAVRWAVEAGVDSIEHGDFLDEETIEEMAKRRTWLVPLFWIGRFHLKHTELFSDRARFESYWASKVDSFRRAREGGVRIAMGSDSGQHGGVGGTEELEYMVQAGCSPMEALTMATRDAAELIGVADRIGTVEVGKEADLVVVNGDPLADIALLQDPERIELVIQRGKLVAGTRISPEALLSRERGPAAMALV